MAIASPLHAIKYRPEIDGLRALAVVPVILFHAGFESFRGGYVGVDIFFVISGFLITTIIVSAQQAGEFQLLNFYERRARRVLPALFVVFLACLPLAAVSLSAPDMARFSQSLIAAACFVSNIFFWHTSGYFDASAELKPLLHTWSLSLEEQYYLLFPLLLLLSARWGGRWRTPLFALIFAASLAYACWSSAITAASAFYLLPGRVWEFLVGTFVAMLKLRFGEQTTDRRVDEAGAVIGAGVIAYAVFCFDDAMRYPGIAALAPTLGAALIILCANEDNLVGRGLRDKRVILLGLISYGAYLWHQPLLAFTRAAVTGAPSQLLLGAVAMGSFIPAYLSWRYVEVPFRQSGRMSRSAIFRWAAMGTMTFGIIGLIGFLQFDHRVLPADMQQNADQKNAVAAYANYDASHIYRRYQCFMEPENTYRDFSQQCSNVPDPNNAVVLWGDSHAAALAPGMRSATSNVIQYTASACPPVVETEFAARPHCLEINRFVLSEIGRLRPRVIILHANWRAYGREDATGHLHQTLLALRVASPLSRLVIVGSVPQWAPSLPIYGVKMKLSLNREQVLPSDGYASLSRLDDSLKATTRQFDGIFLSALDASCSQQGCLAVVRFKEGFQLTAWDYGHLTEGGSVKLAGKLWLQYAEQGGIASAGRE
jgi:peptidoglycan/LPS O-acetylase OafA/YrhL